MLQGSIMLGIIFVTVIAWIPGHSASFLGAESSIKVTDPHTHIKDREMYNQPRDVMSIPSLLSAPKPSDDVYMTRSVWGGSLNLSLHKNNHSNAINIQQLLRQLLGPFLPCQHRSGERCRNRSELPCSVLHMLHRLGPAGLPLHLLMLRAVGRVGRVLRREAVEGGWGSAGAVR